MKNTRLAFLVGILIALTIGATTEQILNSAFDSANNALRVNLVAGGGGGAASDITAGTTTVTTCNDGEVLFDDAGILGCDAGHTYDKTTDRGRFAGGINAGDDGFSIEIPNESGTGTTLNKLVKLTSAGTAIIAATTDTAGVIGVCSAGCGTTGSATVLMIGEHSCVFDSATTANNFVTIDTSTTGNCMDAGSADPAAVTTALVGIIPTTNGAGGTFDVLFNLPSITSVSNITGSGGGSGYTTVQEEGSNLAKRKTLNFSGTGVTCADGSNKTTCTFTGGASTPYLQWTANQAFLPAASFATQDTRNTHPVLDFDAAADECAYFGGVLPASYAGGGLDVTIIWMATSATTGAVGWLTAFESHTDDVDDLDADSFATANSASATTASGTGELQYTTIVHTDGAQIDSLAAGESFRLQVCRDGDGSVVTDDLVGDAEIYKITLVE